jgi:Mor family transcriptional regulator
MDKYIPIHEFCKKYNKTRQNVYRWIREGKIKDYKKIQKTVERIVILDKND